MDCYKGFREDGHNVLEIPEEGVNSSHGWRDLKGHQQSEICSGSRENTVTFVREWKEKHFPAEGTACAKAWRCDCAWRRE